MIGSPNDTTPPCGPGGGGADSTTELLLRAVREGDTHGWDLLDGRFRNMLSFLVRGRIPTGLRQRFDTEDVVQSGLLQAYNKLGGFEFRGKGSLYRWLAQIVRNRLHERIRQHQAERREADRELALREDELHLDGGDTPEAMAAREEHLMRLWGAIAALPGAECELVRRHVAQGEPLGPLARELGLSESTARRRLSSAIGKLRQMLGEHGP